MALPRTQDRVRNLSNGSPILFGIDELIQRRQREAKRRPLSSRGRQFPPLPVIEPALARNPVVQQSALLDRRPVGNERAITNYPEAFLKDISRRMYGNMRASEINRLFGTKGAPLNSRQIQTIRLIAEKVGPDMVNGMLNSPIFADAIRRTGVNLRRRVLEKSDAIKIADALVKESGNLLHHDIGHNIALHDAMHFSGKSFPDFLTEPSQVNNGELLKEELMTFAITTFGDDSHPLLMQLMNPVLAQRQINTLRLQRPIFPRTEDARSKVDLINNRIAIYQEAMDKAKQSPTGMLTYPDLKNLFFKDVREVLRKVQFDAAIKEAESGQGRRRGPISERDKARILFQTNRDYELVMDDLFRNTDRRLEERMKKFHREYPRNPQVLFDIATVDMMGDYLAVIRRLGS